MPRRYSPEDWQFAHTCLVANNGDINLTAKELGVSTTTLYRWQQDGKIPSLSLATLATNSTQNMTDSKSLSVHGEGFREGLPSDDLQALLDLKAEMVRAAKYIAVNIIAAVEAAPLGQRVTALAQLIDRISKLAAQLPAAEADEILVYEGENIYGDEVPTEKTTSETVGDFEE